MASTNKTSRGLTQYIGSDIINFLQDYNGDMKKINELFDASARVFVSETEPEDWEIGDRWIQVIGTSEHMSNESGIFVSETEPEDWKAGDTWIQIINSKKREENTPKTFMSETEPKDWKAGDTWVQIINSKEINNIIPITLEAETFNLEKPLHFRVGDNLSTIKNAVTNSDVANEGDVIVSIN